MAQSHNIVSNQYPYSPIRMELRGHEINAPTLLEMGFDGDIAIPDTWLGRDMGFPEATVPCQMADGRVVHVPVYFSRCHIGESLGLSDVLVTILGHEPMVGRGIIDRYKVTLDNGSRLILEL